jgi:hypothetical protein
MGSELRELVNGQFQIRLPATSGFQKIKNSGDLTIKPAQFSAEDDDPRRNTNDVQILTIFWRTIRPSEPLNWLSSRGFRWRIYGDQIPSVNFLLFLV